MEDLNPKALRDLYEAGKNILYRIDRGLSLGEKLEVEPMRRAIAKAESK